MLEKTPCSLQTPEKYEVKQNYIQSVTKSSTVSLEVEFLKNIDFQRRYDAFSETHDHLFLLQPVACHCHPCTTC